MKWKNAGRTSAHMAECSWSASKLQALDLRLCSKKAALQKKGEKRDGVDGMNQSTAAAEMELQSEQTGLYC